MNPSDDELRALAGRVGERTLARGQVLVTAESCTAGWIAKLCTDHPGSSAWYRGGAVVYDDALKVLDAKHGDAFVAQFAAMKGDVLAAKAQTAEAKAAYRLALEKADKSSEAFRAGVQLRLDALGG